VADEGMREGEVAGSDPSTQLANGWPVGSSL
jgi:hypothetical protein